MLKPHNTTAFKRDLKRLAKSGKDLEKLFSVMVLLANETPLDQKYYDHPLKGNWKGYRECHIEPNWLLVYLVEDDVITFARSGSHSEIFQGY